MDENSRNHLWKEYMSTKNSEIRDKIILEYAPLVKIVAGRLSIYLGYNVEYDDLVGYGIFGLIDAIDKFDYDKGVKFETYASLRIRGAILDQIRKMDWIPRSLRQKQKKMEAAISKIETQYGRPAKDEEIASELGIETEELISWQGQAKITNIISLDEFVEAAGEKEVNAIKSNSYEQPESIALKNEIKQQLMDSLETLTDKEKFKEVYEKINESSKDNRNKDKLISSSKKLLKQAEDKPKKILKKIETLEEKLKESEKDIISINDPDACFMKNKKGKWEFDYNGQIAVDDYKGIILASYITNNPTDYYELIPLMEQVQSNLSEIYDETPVNYQVSSDNGYSTDMNTEYLEQNGFDGYISSRKLSREQKKYNLSDKPFAKDNFFYDNEMMTYIRPLGQPLYKISEYTYKNKSRISHWTKECKTCPMQLFCSKGNRCRVIQDYKIPSKIRMQ